MKFLSSIKMASETVKGSIEAESDGLWVNTSFYWTLEKVSSLLKGKQLFKMWIGEELGLPLFLNSFNFWHVVQSKAKLFTVYNLSRLIDFKMHYFNIKIKYFGNVFCIRYLKNYIHKLFALYSCGWTHPSLKVTLRRTSRTQFHRYLRWTRAEIREHGRQRWQHPPVV